MTSKKLRPEGPACGLREKAGIRQAKPALGGSREPGLLVPAQPLSSLSVLQPVTSFCGSEFPHLSFVSSRSWMDAARSHLTPVLGLGSPSVPNLRASARPSVPSLTQQQTQRTTPSLWKHFLLLAPEMPSVLLILHITVLANFAGLPPMLGGSGASSPPCPPTLIPTSLSPKALNTARTRSLLSTCVRSSGLTWSTAYQTSPLGCVPSTVLQMGQPQGISLNKMVLLL